MLRTNLSTRPFYNERMVHLVLGVIAFVVLILTVLNVIRVVQLSQQNTALSSRIGEDQGAAEDFARRARQIRMGMDLKELKVVVGAVQEANTLIDSRTFSWTEFFNHIETTLPPDVMLTSVRPTIDEDGTLITIVVRARRGPDIDEFMDKLEATGAFEKLLPRQTTVKDDGLTETVVEALYVTHIDDSAPKGGPAPAPAPTPAPAPAPAAPPAKRGTP
jgi:hypothetical protein